MSVSTPNKGGRPRIHASNAARVAAWRAKRKKTEVSLQCPNSEETASPPTSDSQAEWNKYLSKVGLSVDKGLYIADAPRGCGKQHSGGHDSNRFVYLEDTEHLDRRRGYGPDK
jgi:hypothetical protein